MSGEADNSKCPACGCEHIEGGFIEICGEEAVQSLNCTACNASWDEIYIFDRRDNIKPALARAQGATHA